MHLHSCHLICLQFQTPTITIFVVFFSLALLACLSRAFLRRRRENARYSDATPTEPRELTANQLAGTDGTSATGNNGARRTRRPRRPRRTPSQMSVTSLPEYMKEPGAEEVVIFRCVYLGLFRASMFTIHTSRAQSNEPMPDGMVDEEREDERSQDSQRYSPLSASQTNAPLLHEDETDSSERNMQISTENIRRQSIGSGSDYTSSLNRLDTPDPSPAYFEVVGDDEPEELRIYPPSAALSTAPPPPPERPAPQSGFRNLLNRISTHQRGDSGNTALLPSARSGTQPQHRQTPSTSSSFFNSFRPLSRQRSTHTINSDRMNSPSVISLNSISPPLTHTAVRTEFTYPKTGPTAEQLKIIASRDSIGKFGVPYGPDAIAFAASTSWHDLLPPPGFEVMEESQIPSRPSPGPSGLRSLVLEAGSSAEELAGFPSRGDAITASSSVPNGTAEPITAANDSPTQEQNPETWSENSLQPSTLSRDTPVSQTPSIIPSKAVDSIHNTPSRSDSMSSNVTYVTATNSIHPSGASSPENGSVDSDRDSTGYSVEAPMTPTFAAAAIRGHEAEPTDVTITLANASG